MADNEAPLDIPGFLDLVPIGSGGFGSVYRAVQEHIGRIVAIKVLDRLDDRDAKGRDRFLRETRAMGELSKVPNVVDIYLAQFTPDGWPYLVMPFYEGGSLADHLAAKGPLPVTTVVWIGTKIAIALDQAHRRGITHRDLKPENILVDESGEPALTDFGIAITATDAASTRTRLSMTPEHAPPERLAATPGVPVSEPLADVYSLGSTLWALLAGGPPFGREQELGTYEFVRRVVEQPLGAIPRSDVPPDVLAALSKAMAKQPADRYESAAEFAAALTACLRDPVVPLAALSPSSAGATSAAPTSHGLPNPNAQGAVQAVTPVLPPDAHPTQEGTRVIDAAPIGTTAGDGTSGPSATAGIAAIDPVALQPPEIDRATGQQGVAPTAYRPYEAARRSEVGQVDEPARSRVPLVVAAIGGILLLCIGLIVLSTRSKSPATNGGTAPAGPQVPVGTVFSDVSPPVVTEINELADGGLAFKWEYAPGTEGAPFVLYQVAIDGRAASTPQALAAGSDDKPLAEQLLTADQVAGRGGVIDTAAHQYCVQLALAGAAGTTPFGQPKCIGSGSVTATR